MTVPLADVHCHLLAGLDDGPRTWDDALAMCRMAAEDGTRWLAAGCHQNDRWPVTPDAILSAATELSDLLRQNEVPVTVFPCAEVMVHPDMETSWTQGRLLSVGNHRKYLLVEMPHGVFVDLRDTVRRFHGLGVRLILAHPERQPELLFQDGAIEELIRLSCLVQVSAGSVTAPASPRAERSLKSWFQRGCVHLLGSDGHSPRRRPPRMAEAYEQIRRWTGAGVAERICGANGSAVLQGQPLSTPEPQPKRPWWRWW
jgi:protein-tyrosine phosphatase